MKILRVIWVVGSLLVSQSAWTQWAQLPSPNGAYVPALVTNGADFFAGTPNGVYSSGNRGALWNSANTGLPTRSITALAFADTILFAGTFDRGVFRSTDHGTQWVAMDSGLTNVRVDAFAAGNSFFFAGTRAGVYRTSDHGIHWTKASSGLPTAKVIVRCLATKDTLLFAGIPHYGVYHSSDDGISWTLVRSGLPPDPQISSMAVIGGCIILGTDTSGIFRSTDNGATWAQAINGLGSLRISSLGVGPEGRNGRSLLAGTSDGIYLSADSGRSWSAASHGVPSRTPVTSLLATDSGWFAGTLFRGIYLSTNGGANWSAVNAGLTNTYVITFGVKGVTLFAGTLGLGLFRSIDEGATWRTAGGGLPADVDILSFTSRKADLFLGTSEGVYRSTDNGATWGTTSAGLPAHSRVQALTFAGLDLFAATLDSGVYRSSDNGADWQPASTGLTFKGILALAASGNDLFAGGQNGVHRSTNSGKSWLHVGLQLTIVQTLAVTGNDLFAGLIGGGLYHSSNSGLTWTSASAGLPLNTSIGSFATSNIGLFVSTYHGVFLSTNSGNSWMSVNSGLTNTDAPALAVIEPILFAGTYGSGIWRRSLLDMVTDVSPEPSLPGAFGLEQNYPNPFNPRTEIRSQMSEARHVKLVVYDLLGREVAVLVDEQRAAGSYRDTFDGSGLASGVYIYRLTSGSVVLSRRMLLIK